MTKEERELQMLEEKLEILILEKTSAKYLVSTEEAISKLKKKINEQKNK